MHVPTEYPDLDDLEITRVTRRRGAAGTWVAGRAAGHRFEALVFPAHATDPAFELAGSRVSKLWVQRLADKTVVFNWDRGLDVAAADPAARAVVALVAEGLADHVYPDGAG
jgi:hypothetical protein